MKLFDIWFRRISPQHHVTVVEAQDVDAAWRIAKEQGILHPVVGEKISRRERRKMNDA